METDDALALGRALGRKRRHSETGVAAPSPANIPRLLKFKPCRLKSQFFALDMPSFLSWRTSLDASASSQSRKVTIFGRAAVAFGQMIQ